MDKTKLHSKYLEKLKKLKIKEMPGLEWDRILYLGSLYIMDKTDREVATHIIRVLFFGISDLIFDITGNSILFLTTIHHRNDHDSYYKAIRDLFDHKDEIIYDHDIIRAHKIHLIKIKGMIRRVRLYKSFFEQLKDFEDIRHRRYLAADLLRCHMIKEEVQGRAIKAKVVISFFDANMFENLIIQILRKNGVISVTNQHGQPLFRSWDYDHMNQSQIFNFTSDFFLAKGYFTKKQFINAGRNADGIIVVGDMMKKDPLSWRFNKNKIFGVFLDTPAYTFAKRTNMKLLKIADEIASDLGYRYIVKLHPTDCFQNYSELTLRYCINKFDKRAFLSDLFSMIDFGIMHASSIYVDLISNGLRAFQMKTDIYYPVVDEPNDIFEDLDDIRDKIRDWDEMSDKKKKDYLMDEKKKYLFDGPADDEIKKFILSLIKNQDRFKIRKYNTERGRS